MKEEWLPIKEYEELYEISNLGNVMSLPKEVLHHHGNVQKFGGRLLKPRTHSKGYLQVELAKKGTRKTITIHRLVAEHFIENPNDFPMVNHIDENKQNNVVTNLEWCDGFHNMEHSMAMNFVFKSPSGEKVEIYNLSKFCRENGLRQGCMSNVHNESRLSHKGWTKW